jgi:hypothetical protein
MDDITISQEAYSSIGGPVKAKNHGCKGVYLQSVFDSPSLITRLMEDFFFYIVGTPQCFHLVHGCHLELLMGDVSLFWSSTSADVGDLFT